MVPSKTPRAIVDLLNAEVTKILNMPDVMATLFNQGLDPWAKVIKESGAKPE